MKVTTLVPGLSPFEGSEKLALGGAPGGGEDLGPRFLGNLDGGHPDPAGV